MRPLPVILLAVLLPVMGLSTASFSATKKKSGSRKTAPVKPKSPLPREAEKKTPDKVDIILTPEQIFRFGKEAASAGARSRMPQIDILNAVYLKYREDPELLAGRKRIIIQGEEFRRAFVQIEPLFEAGNRAGKNDVFQSKIRPPEIRYRNFRNIILFHDYGRHRISIELNEAYTQELPYTFGARIKLAQTIEGTLRSDDKTKVTEVVFDSDRSVFFQAPGIAFFVPDVYTRIARITVEDGEMFGYVIGRPESDMRRHVAIRYNLSTCAKSSIKSDEMSPEEYSRKLSRVN
jgi:hypothetical protein